MIAFPFYSSSSSSDDDDDGSSTSENQDAQSDTRSQESASLRLQNNLSSSNNRFVEIASVHWNERLGERSASTQQHSCYKTSNRSLWSAPKESKAFERSKPHLWHHLSIQPISKVYHANLHGFLLVQKWSRERDDNLWRFWILLSCYVGKYLFQLISSFTGMRAL